MLQLLGPSTGGIRQVVAALAHGLGDRGWEVWCAGPAGVLDGLAEQHAVVPVPRGWRALRRLAGDVDIVHAHGLTAGWLAATVRPRPPLVLTVHNLVLDEVAGRSAPLLRTLEGALPRMVDATIAVSSEIAHRFGGRAAVIPPAGPAPRVTRSAAEVRAAYGVPPDARLIVTAARLHPQKDLPTLFEAVSRLTGVRLLVLGTGPDEASLRAMLRARGLESVVTLAGQVPSVADELAAADVVVVSSRWESGPLVLREAMELGRPVVSTRVGFAPDLVDDGVSGRLVPVGDAGALADALQDVLADEALAAKLGSGARRSVSVEHGVSAMVTATEVVYRGVLHR